MSNTPERLTAVDALRGIAVLMVVAVHTSGFIAPGSEWLAQMTRLGPRGVQLFYVISAFSLFLSFANRRAASGFSYRDYFIRRVARVAPMFWLSMMLYLFAFGMGPNYWSPAGITFKDVALTGLFLNGWSPTRINSIVPGGWSVAIETMFYLILPFCFIWIRSLRAAIVVTALSLAFRYFVCSWMFNAQVSGFPDNQRYLPFTFAWEFWLPAQLPVFMLGIVLFFVREKLVSVQQQGLGLFWLGGAVALIAASQWMPVEGVIPPAFMAGSGFVLLALGLFDRDLRLLDNVVLRRIGEASFSIYLLHHLVMHFGAGHIVRLLTALGLQTSGDWAYLLTLAIVVLVSTAASLITYRFVELPSIALGARLAKWTKPRASATFDPRVEAAS